MNALESFVDTVRCYDGACGAVAAPEPWFAGALAICLAVLWQGARATSAVASAGPAAAAGTQLLGRRYATVLTALLFVAWFLTAFGLSVPALGAVQDPLAWTAMVPLHATLLLSGPALVVGSAAFVAAALRRPARFLPASRRTRAVVVLGVLALPAGWRMAGARAPELVADPTTTASGWLADALGAGPLDEGIGGLWWLAGLLTTPAALAVAAAAAAGYVLLPRPGEPAPAAAPQHRPSALVSGSSRRGSGGTRVRATPERPVRTLRRDPAPAGPRGTAVRASTLALGTVVAVVGGAAAVAALVAGLAAMPGQGPAVVAAVLAGYVGLGVLLRAR